MLNVCFCGNIERSPSSMVSTLYLLLLCIVNIVKSAYKEPAYKELLSI